MGFAMLRLRICKRGLYCVVGFAAVALPLLGRGQPATPVGPDMAQLERGFRDTVQPFVRTYCTECHSGPKAKCDLDLGGFATAEAVTKDLQRWETVLEQLEAGN